jgi:hypothetical protein
MQCVSRYQETTKRTSIKLEAQQNIWPGSVADNLALPADDSRGISRKIKPLVIEIPAASASNTSESQIRCSRSFAGFRNAAWNTPYKERMHNTKATGLATSTNTTSTSPCRTVYRYLSALACRIWHTSKCDLHYRAPINSEKRTELATGQAPSQALFPIGHAGHDSDIDVTSICPLPRRS